MSFPEEKLITFIACYGELEWYKYSIRTNSDEYIFLPSIIWRYKDEESVNIHKLQIDIKTIFDKLPLQLDWIVYKYHNNWVVQPEIIYALEKKETFLSEREIKEFIIGYHPEFISHVSTDYEKIVNEIKNIVLSNTFF